VFREIRQEHIKPVPDKELISGAINGILKLMPELKNSVAARTAWQRLASGRVGIYDSLEIFGDFVDGARREGAARIAIKQLMRAAVDGILNASDPYSSFIDDTQTKLLQQPQSEDRDRSASIGVNVGLFDGVLKVAMPLYDMPAAKAGLWPGDLITHVDGEPIKGLTLEQGIDKLRGPLGTPVTIRVTRKGKDQPFDLTIVRQTIWEYVVRSSVVDGNVGYVRLLGFKEHTDEDLKKAIAELTAPQVRLVRGRPDAAADLKGYILDLRGNTGGLLDQVIKVTGTLLGQGTIFVSKGRTAELTSREVGGSEELIKNKPIVVLVNGDTASGAEVLAGALQERGRAKVVGTRSHGAGVIRTLIPLGGAQGTLALTTGWLILPSGKSIEGIGIEPDISVEAGAGQAGQLEPAQALAIDPQLQAALKEVRRN
jgi:carboxyl-terminal processing protease